MNSVLFGLIAASVLDGFVLNANAVEMKLMSTTQIGGNCVQTICPAGHVAVACKCSGSCLDDFQPSLRICRAQKEIDESTTVMATCVKDDHRLYFFTEETSPSCYQTIACYVRGNPDIVPKVVTDTDGQAVCEADLGDCSSCKIKTLCKERGCTITEEVGDVIGEGAGNDTNSTDDNGTDGNDNDGTDGNGIDGTDNKGTDGADGFVSDKNDNDNSEKSVEKTSVHIQPPRKQKHTLFLGK